MLQKKCNPNDSSHFKPSLLLRVVIVLVVFQSQLCAQETILDYKKKFIDPPFSAKPRTWWHWTKSNISKEGITKDLEWMKRVGIAGFQLSDVNAGGGQTVTSPLVFGSSEWLDAVHFSASEAERLGLEMSIFSSAGWSLTGGPWVKPEEAMKKLVWSETTISGGTNFSAKLPQPPSAIGAIRNLSSPGSAPGFYKDFAVIAFPADANSRNDIPAITTSKGAINAEALLDDDLNSAVTVNTGGKPGAVWVQFTYPAPITAKALSIASRRGIPFGRLMASTDGNNYNVLATFPGKSGYRGSTVRTFSFAAVTAKYFRVELTGAPFRPADVISEATTAPDTAYQLNELKLFTTARVNRWEDKAGFNFLFEYESVATPDNGDAIAPSAIIDLTSKMNNDGILNWDPPPGKWTIMRFGYSLTGAKNRPAVPSGLGYEADKLSKKHMESYLRGYTAPLMKTLGKLYGSRLQYMLFDSWEAGIQNWTDEMLPEFQKRRGYDLKSYLPALAGHVVGSSNISDRFLWDFRRTLVDMFAENCYGTATEFLHQQGIKTYGEAGGVSLESMEDALLNKKYVDIPMGEFWVKDLHPSSMYYEDVRGAASAGHIYGKNIIAAEAFTGGNYESPYTLKKISDYWFTQGINRIVFHTSAHQPLDTKPGNTMVGTHIHRNITWAEQAAPFMNYLSRNAYLLQQGRYVADIAYLLNEGAPSTMPFWGGGLQPATPEGYQFDYVNADVVINSMKTDTSGRMVLPGGMSYRILVLPNTQQMTLPLLRKLKELVNNGATIAGPRPMAVPGLSDEPGSQQLFNNLVTELWGDLDGSSRTRRNVGKGQVTWGMPLTNIMTSLKLAPDLQSNKPLDGELSWIHRQDGEHDIYFLVNRSDQPQDYTVRFRVSGKEPELWHSDNGSTEPAPYTMLNGKTTMSLRMDERESVFVVFSKKTGTSSRSVPAPFTQEWMRIDGPWKISFPEKYGTPASIMMDNLSSWTESRDSGVKYFSGTATYSKSFEVKKDPGKSTVLLDLGKVGDMAEIILNGKKLELLWKAPFRGDISHALQKGKNILEIKVTNEWTNRLMGDKDAPADKKVLPIYTNPFGGQYQLAEAGLMGPVRLLKADEPNK
ncbi:MAG: glycosyl hydrolase [Bacteroidota bacterium]